MIVRDPLWLVFRSRPRWALPEVVAVCTTETAARAALRLLGGDSLVASYDTTDWYWWGT